MDDKKNAAVRGLLLVLGLLLALLPGAVLAHDGDTVIRFGSFLGGLTHPVLGLDHLLAMLCVGIVSAQIGGRAIWTVPATFVGVMAVGGVIGILLSGLTGAVVETGIAFSLIVLGTVIFVERRLPLAGAMIAVGFFALFHGYAHGSEIPAVANGVTYALGFVTGSALIHVAGVIVGDISQHYQAGKLLMRAGGGLIGVIGLLFLVGLV